jgi:hypothetical protein
MLERDTLDMTFMKDLRHHGVSQVIQPDGSAGNRTPMIGR